MSTETLIRNRNEHRARAVFPSAGPTEKYELREAAHSYAKRVHRLKIHAAVWALATIVITALWALNQWDANGAFERFGSEGNPGDWNPTLWALVVGAWGLMVGLMALRVYFERPATETEIDREVARVKLADASADELRRSARSRLERIRRLKFHVAAWGLGMIVLTPVWALIEWQDNGGFDRFGSSSQPGEWDPWILYIGGVWALFIAVFALRVYVGRNATRKGQLSDWTARVSRR